MGANDLKTVTLHRPAPASSPVVEPARPWTVEAIQALLDKPFLDLLFEAQSVHRAHWPEGTIELATLLSVKTGGCPENCGYCPQAAEFDTGVKAEKLMAVDEVVRAAQAAKDAGATRNASGLRPAPRSTWAKNGRSLTMPSTRGSPSVAVLSIW